MRLFMRYTIAALLLAGFTATGAVAQGTSTANPTVSAMDKSADSCVDFDQFACGGWKKNNPIPSDQPIWSRFGELAERNRVVLRGILENAGKAANRTANE